MITIYLLITRKIDTRALFAFALQVALQSILFASVNVFGQTHLLAQTAHLLVQFLKITIRDCHATWREKVNYNLL